MAEERRAIHAYLTVGGHDVWHSTAEDAGVSLSGLLEAMAADFREHQPDEGGHPRWDEVVKAARRIDAQRRRRSPA
ncbi:MAG: hypothetical protein R2726_00980 [Acidimicrobiales bacterium]